MGLRLRLTTALLAWGTILCALRAAPACARGEDSFAAPVAPFRITQQDGEAGFQFRSLSETDKSDGHSIDMSSRSFEEYVQYHTRGYVYHPRFLDFDSRVKIGLLQQSFDNSGLDSDARDFTPGSANSFLAAYHFYLSFLKEHPLSFTIHADRDRDAILELFTDRIMTETESHGASLHWKKGPFPMDLAVNQSRFKQWGFESRSDAKMDTLDYSIRNAVGKWMQSELRYNYRDYEETFDANAELFDTHRRTRLKSHDLNFTNSIYFDPSRRSSLTTLMRMYKQSGSQDFDNFSWQERLNLQHTPNLRSYYLFDYMQTKLHDETVDSYRGEVGLDHKLYESLESHLDLHWRESRYGDLSDRQFGPTGRLGYRKYTPWGVLSAGYSLTVDQIERSGGGGVRPVQREPLTLRSGVNNYLSQPAVDAASIEVFSPDGATEYVEGFDYEVRVQGNRTALRILPGGRLPDNAPVVVDYDVEFTSDINFTQTDQDFHINYDFEKFLRGLSIYYRWHDLSPLNAPEDDVTILAFSSHLAGFAYHWRWFTWRNEYTIYNSNFSNYNQFMSQIDGLHELGARLRLAWNLGATLTDYTDEGLPKGQDYDNAYYAGLALRGPIRANGYWEIGGQARREQGQVDETLFGLLGKLGFRWRRSKIEAGVRLEARERFDTERNRSAVFLQFSREF